MKEIRLLSAQDIECRAQQVAKDFSWCSLLLYKNARVDMQILDETFGRFGWKRSHELINGRLYCTVSIYDDEKGQWVSKQDVGVESNTEAEKGQASDAFKRACFNVGIGRELYTAPKIFISLTKDDVKNSRLSTRFYVRAIEYTNNQISYLQIVDNKGILRYEYADKNKVIKNVKSSKTLDDLTRIFNTHRELQSDNDFISALTNRKNQLQTA
nr:MAG TPA: Rad52/22 family double-strand break repair protein [Caudoviricetes sp.]